MLPLRRGAGGGGGNNLFNPFRTSSSFYVSALQITVFSTHLEKSLPFPLELKLSSANSLSLEESKLFVWERVKHINAQANPGSKATVSSRELNENPSSYSRLNFLAKEGDQVSIQLTPMESIKGHISR